MKKIFKLFFWSFCAIILYHLLTLSQVITAVALPVASTLTGLNLAASTVDLSLIHASVRVKNFSIGVSGKTPFLSLDDGFLDASVIDFFYGKTVVNELELHGIHLLAEESAEGSWNWPTSLESNPVSSTVSDSAPCQMERSWNIKRINISGLSAESIGHSGKHLALSDGLFSYVQREDQTFSTGFSAFFQAQNADSAATGKIPLRWIAEGRSDAQTGLPTELQARFSASAVSGWIADAVMDTQMLQGSLSLRLHNQHLEILQCQIESSSSKADDPGSLCRLSGNLPLTGSDSGLLRIQAARLSPDLIQFISGFWFRGGIWDKTTLIYQGEIRLPPDGKPEIKGILEARDFTFRRLPRPIPVAPPTEIRLQHALAYDPENNELSVQSLNLSGRADSEQILTLHSAKPFRLWLAPDSNLFGADGIPELDIMFSRTPAALLNPVISFLTDRSVSGFDHGWFWVDLHLGQGDSQRLALSGSGHLEKCAMDNAYVRLIDADGSFSLDGTLKADRSFNLEVTELALSEMKNPLVRARFGCRYTDSSGELNGIFGFRGFPGRIQEVITLDSSLIPIRKILSTPQYVSSQLSVSGDFALTEGQFRTQKVTTTLSSNEKPLAEFIFGFGGKRDHLKIALDAIIWPDLIHPLLHEMNQPELERKLRNYWRNDHFEFQTQAAYSPDSKKIGVESLNLSLISPEGLSLLRFETDSFGLNEHLHCDSPVSFQISGTDSACHIIALIPDNFPELIHEVSTVCGENAESRFTFSGILNPQKNLQLDSGWLHVWEKENHAASAALETPLDFRWDTRTFRFPTFGLLLSGDLHADSAAVFLPEKIKACFSGGRLRTRLLLRHSVRRDQTLIRGHSELIGTRLVLTQPSPPFSLFHDGEISVDARKETLRIQAPSVILSPSENPADSAVSRFSYRMDYDFGRGNGDIGLSAESLSLIPLQRLFSAWNESFPLQTGTIIGNSYFTFEDGALSRFETGLNAIGMMGEKKLPAPLEAQLHLLYQPFFSRANVEGKLTFGTTGDSQPLSTLILGGSLPIPVDSGKSILMLESQDLNLPLLSNYLASRDSPVFTESAPSGGLGLTNEIGAFSSNAALSLHWKADSLILFNRDSISGNGEVLFEKGLLRLQNDVIYRENSVHFLAEARTDQFEGWPFFAQICAPKIRFDLDSSYLGTGPIFGEIAEGIFAIRGKGFSSENLSRYGEGALSFRIKRAELPLYSENVWIQLVAIPLRLSLGVNLIQTASDFFSNNIASFRFADGTVFLSLKEGQIHLEKVRFSAGHPLREIRLNGEVNILDGNLRGVSAKVYPTPLTVVSFDAGGHFSDPHFRPLASARGTLVGNVENVLDLPHWIEILNPLPQTQLLPQRPAMTDTQRTFLNILLNRPRPSESVQRGL